MVVAVAVAVAVAPGGCRHGCLGHDFEPGFKRGEDPPGFDDTPFRAGGALVLLRGADGLVAFTEEESSVVQQGFQLAVDVEPEAGIRDWLSGTCDRGDSACAGSGADTTFAVAVAAVVLGRAGGPGGGEVEELPPDGGGAPARVGGFEDDLQVALEGLPAVFGE